ncbi:MAG: GTPase Era [Myxococcota bacterium]
MAEPRRAHRAGIVAILGPPNAGKSTLMNAVLGEKLAIVTAKPQTTRSRILGIHSVAGAQIAFVDTPGRHESGKPLNVALNEVVTEVAEGCDLGLVLVDLRRGWEPIHQSLVDELRARGTPYILAGSKCDLAPEAPEPWPAEVGEGAVARLRLSARTGEGLDALEAALVEALPDSPPLYPEDELTDRPLRWLAAELVREALFEELGQELPYQMAVEVVEFDESRAELVRIRANVLVLRDSQKRIVVGRGGEVVKAIGTRARAQIEKLVGTKVFLELRVKIDPRWLKNPKRIKSLGYV